MLCLEEGKGRCGSRLLHFFHALHAQVPQLVEGRLEGQVVTVLKMEKHESHCLLEQGFLSPFFLGHLLLALCFQLHPVTFLVLLLSRVLNC